MHMACTARVADATHEPAEHNDEYPYKTSYRQVSVKHMSNITVTVDQAPLAVSSHKGRLE